MAKTLTNYDPLVQIPSGMTPAGADFPIVESHDILVGENDKRLDAKLDDIDSAIGNVGQTPIATQLSSKVNTGDIQTTVRDASSASDSKIPSEKAVRSAIDSKTINVDSTVTQGSTNAVSGGAVYTQLATKQDTLTFDTTPTASSSNPVTSGGVKSALDTKQDALTFDTTPTASSSNPVTSGGVKAALDTKQNTLTYETTPIVGSVNPVTSTGIRNAIDTAAAQNLGAMQAQYAEFVADADAVLDRASSLSNGMVACSNISAETTVGDTRILLYTGTTNADYTNGHWYYNSAPSNAAPSWTDGGAVGSAPTIDNTLTVEGAAANSKAVGDAIENIVTISNTQPGSNSGNKVWIKETTSEEVQVPTYEEHIAKANKADIATNNESDNGSGTITASKKYAIGDHFYINNTNTSSENFGVSTLYKATAAIASGDAIVVGTNCEASKVADEITSLSNDIDTIKADLKNQINYTNNDITTLGNRLDYKFPKTLAGLVDDNKSYTSTGLYDNNSAICCTKKLYANASKITCSNKVELVAFFDEYKNFIERVTYLPNVYEFDIPNGAYYCALMFNKNNVPYSDAENSIINGLSIFSGIETIEVGEDKHFKTVLSALWYASQSTNPIEIRIDEGEYDIYSELGGDSYVALIPSTATWSSGIQPVISVPIKIIGIGNVVLKMQIPQATYSNYTHQCTRLSQINAKKSLEIDNITFISQYNRYAVHIECDNSALYKGSNINISNCKFYQTVSMAAIGIGTSSESNYEIRNCFITNTAERGIYLHNWNNQAKSNLTIDGTIIDNNHADGRGVVLGVNGTNIVDVFISNSWVKDVNVSSENQSIYNTNIYRIFALNTNLETIGFASNITSNPYTPVIK